MRILFFMHVVLLPVTSFCALDQALLEQVYTHHCTQLNYTDIKHDPYLITFSGTPGMGKSVVAKKLEEELCAVVVRTDAIRALLHTIAGVTLQEYDAALSEYMIYFFKRYNLPNRRLILDASIDRKYVLLFPFLAEHKIPFVVIRLIVPRELVEARLKEREGERVGWYLKHLDAWLQDYILFAAAYHDYISCINTDGAPLENLVLTICHKIELGAL